MAKDRSGSSRDLEEFAEATARARTVRERVARQLHDAIIEFDGTGSRGLLVQRITQASVASRGLALPKEALRAAVFECAVAAAAWVVGIDLGQDQPSERAA